MKLFTCPIADSFLAKVDGRYPGAPNYIGVDVFETLSRFEGELDPDMWPISPPSSVRGVTFPKS